VNLFLLFVGGNLATLRNLLGWTQDDFCKKLDISRSFLINVEKDPTRFDYRTAVTLFSIVKMEMDSRRKKIEQLKPPDMINEKSIPGYLAALSSAGLTAQFLSSIISPLILGVGEAALDTVKSSKLMKKSGFPIVGSIVSLAAIVALYSATKINSGQKQAAPKDLHAAAIQSFAVLESKVRDCLGVQALSIEEFMANIDKGKEMDTGTAPDEHEPAS